MNGCGLDVCPNYQQMADLAVTKKPAVVVVAGGQNDFDDYAADPEKVTAAINATFTKLRSKLPKAKIVAVGPSTPWAVGENVLGLDAAVQDAAGVAKATYVSLLDLNVVTPDMTLADKAHVNGAATRP